MEISQIYLYRITHIKNIPHILKYGITHKSSPHHDENFVAIGDRSLISYRDSETIPVHGRNLVLGEFIPFYFGIRMPMLYTIQHGYNYTNATPPKDIVYLAVSLKRIIDDNRLTFYFSDGHSTSFLTKYYSKNEVDQLPRILDWNAIKARRWSGDGVETDLMRRKQAEFLVKPDIPPELIHGYLCYNEEAESRLVEYGVAKKDIKIFPNAYY